MGYSSSKGSFPPFSSDPFGLKSNEQKTYLKQIPRMFCGFLFYLIGTYLNSVSQVYLQMQLATFYENRWKPINGTKDFELWDLGHRNLPYFDAGAMPLLAPDSLA